MGGQIQEAGAERARIPVLKTYKIYVDGKFPRTESGRYFQFKSPAGGWSANLCECSRKDFRDAVTAARGAFAKWSKATPFNRGQILYRVAEMLEGRKAQFVEELLHQGLTRAQAESEVAASVDRLVYYAGWTDKFQQVFSAVNPVASSYFNFSVLEPTGVVAVLAPEESSLLGLVSCVAPVIAGGNSCVVLASSRLPLCAVTLGEVLNSSDVPGGVVNILTGFRKELLAQFSSHMDVNGVLYCGDSAEEIRKVQTDAALNVKRVSLQPEQDWAKAEAQGPYPILAFQEVKTTWHPIGN
ncbi:MAG: aldehyde dehydrogenase family protein [Oligoflexia bacterium]|nr:aldehyde dehydrogenase family protein [Oligoflexia bacterium]